MPAPGAAEENHWLEPSLASEIFHDLSQPLTALHCSLDLALRGDRTLEELRSSVQSALEDAERLRQRLLMIRALSDALDPGDTSRAIDLIELFRELCDDMSPLFESAGQKLQLEAHCKVLRVGADQRRLMRAFFCLLEYLFRYSPEGSVLKIAVRRWQQRAEIRMMTASCLPLSPSTEEPHRPYSCEIELARRAVMAVGGEFILVSSAPHQSVWLAKLPLASE